QRVDQRDKDYQDIAALLVCCVDEFTERERPAVVRITNILSSDWGFCHTAVANLKKLEGWASSAQSVEIFNSGTRQELSVTLKKLLGVVSRSPKSVAWQLRSLLGE